MATIKPYLMPAIVALVVIAIVFRVSAVKSIVVGS
jgi:hypothetical protein